jgi:hypothetical protein
MGYSGPMGYAAACATAFALAFPAAAQRLTKDEQVAISRSPEQISWLVSVQDDPLETSAVISTEPFFKKKQGLFGTVSSDKFMRAIVDKKSGAISYQLYIWVSYYGDWQFFDQVNLETSSGPLPAKTRVLDRNVVSCAASRFAGCLMSEHLAVDVDEAVLRGVAAGASAGTADEWRFRVMGRSGGTTTGILRTEVAAVVLAAERYRQSLNK